MEIGENSIIGRLLAGDLAGAIVKLQEMEAEINEIAGPGTCGVSVSPEELLSSSGENDREGENG